MTQPPWVQQARVKTSGWSYEGPVNFTQDWPTLLWQVNFGCVELIP